ncbi:MAG: hypothetical protein NTU79_09305 [Planctomycetota bacterium]|nr:hypothetical protein [Planctomycetota bacterium]
MTPIETFSVEEKSDDWDYDAGFVEVTQPYWFYDEGTNTIVYFDETDYYLWSSPDDELLAKEPEACPSTDGSDEMGPPRQLDSVSKESMSKDPIGYEAGDINLYRYVGNHGTYASDASGLFDDDFKTVRSCVVCHNPVMMYGTNEEKQRFLEDNPAMVRGILEATKKGYVQDAMTSINAMQDGASISRSAVGAGAFVATAPVSIPLAFGATVSIGTLEYSVSGDIGKALDNVPFVPLRHTSSQVKTILSGDEEDKLGAFVGLSLNTASVIPLAKSGLSFASRIQLQPGALSQTSMFGPLNQLRLSPLVTANEIAPEMQILSAWSRANGYDSAVRGVDAFVAKLPSVATPNKSAANQFEIRHTGDRNYLVTGG